MFSTSAAGHRCRGLLAWACTPHKTAFHTWRSHGISTLSALQALSGGSPISGGSPVHRPVIWSFGVFLDAHTTNRFIAACVYVFSICALVGCLGFISMAQRKTAVTPLLTHWSYCSLALSHQYELVTLDDIISLHNTLRCPRLAGNRCCTLYKSINGVHCHPSYRSGRQ